MKTMLGFSQEFSDCLLLWQAVKAAKEAADKMIGLIFMDAKVVFFIFAKPIKNRIHEETT